MVKKRHHFLRFLKRRRRHAVLSARFWGVGIVLFVLAVVTAGL
jgi:hypothetical protein